MSLMQNSCQDDEAVVPPPFVSGHLDRARGLAGCSQEEFCKRLR